MPGLEEEHKPQTLRIVPEYAGPLTLYPSAQLSIGRDNQDNHNNNLVLLLLFILHVDGNLYLDMSNYIKSNSSMGSEKAKEEEADVTLVGAVVEQDCDNILGALEHGSKSTDPVKEMASMAAVKVDDEEGNLTVAGCLVPPEMREIAAKAIAEENRRQREETADMERIGRKIEGKGADDAVSTIEGDMDTGDDDEIIKQEDEEGVVNPNDPDLGRSTSSLIRELYEDDQDEAMGDE
ncbi:hypothetical protein MMC28_005538 [Mycoblastus sanguinarius]|nr:hypothetical protein [Mycoblastus sanguinarius]